MVLLNPGLVGSHIKYPLGTLSQHLSGTKADGGSVSTRASTYNLCSKGRELGKSTEHWLLNLLTFH